MNHLEKNEVEDVWLELAELFFLDTEHEDYVFESTAKRLKEIGLNAAELRIILEKQVAPVAGVNLGYLIYPVIGAWSGFDRDDLIKKIKDYSDKREKRPQLLYCIQDLLVRRMLKILGAEKFFRKYF